MTPVPTRADAGAARPLYVDLDGTLLLTDTIWESAMQLLRNRPAMLFCIPFWLLGGKAHFKRKLAERGALNARLLPYNEEVLAFIRDEKERGRTIFLATASDRLLAEPIAHHLLLFDGVLASDGRSNISGERKLRAIRENSGEQAFDYIGNSPRDLPIWSAAANVLVASSSARLLRRVRKQRDIDRVFAGAPAGALPLLRALRPHQWIKNLVLFVPLFMAHRWREVAELRTCGIAFVCFCLCASAGYLFNDLFDLEADRAHPLKRKRPLASGTLGIPAALAALAACFAAGIALAAAALPPLFLGSLFLYAILVIAYSLYLKRKLLVDVLLLAGLYSLRVLAGGLAAEVEISRWMLAFTMFIFLSLAFAKRGAELILLRGADSSPARRRAYRPEDLDLVRSMGPAAGYMAVLVLCLYINSAEVKSLYRNVDALWAICPILLYWISRIWFLVGRGHLPDDPVLFATRDPISLLSGLLIMIIVLLASI